MSTKAYYPISEIGAGKTGFSKTRSIIEAAFYGCGCRDAAADQRQIPVWLYGKKSGYSGQAAHVGQKYRL